MLVVCVVVVVVVFTVMTAVVCVVCGVIVRIALSYDVVVCHIADVRLAIIVMHVVHVAAVA